MLSAAGSMLVLALALPFAGGGFGKPASGAEGRAVVDEAGQEGEALPK